MDTVIQDIILHISSHRKEVNIVAVGGKLCFLKNTSYVHHRTQPCLLLSYQVLKEMLTFSGNIPPGVRSGDQYHFYLSTTRTWSRLTLTVKLKPSVEIRGTAEFDIILCVFFTISNTCHIKHSHLIQCSSWVQLLKTPAPMEHMSQWCLTNECWFFPVINQLISH